MNKKRDRIVFLKVWEHSEDLHPKRRTDSDKLIEQWDGDWEEIPDEDIWEDGEITQKQVSQKILNNFYSGQWKLIREIK